MAEYTKQIQQLERTASKTPQFAPPSNSLGADLVNAAATGFQIYQQMEAKDELSEVKQQQVAYNKKLSDASMKYRNLLIDLQAQGLSPMETAKRTKNFFNQYGDSGFAMDVISSVKKSTGATGFSALTKAQEEQRRRDSELEAEAELRQESILQGEAFAMQVKGISEQDAVNATEEQKMLWKKQSDRMNAAIEQQKSIMEVSEDVTSNILSVQRIVFSNKLETQIDKIKEAQRTGDMESAKQLGQELQVLIRTSATQAPTQIKQIMEAQGKGAFYDAPLVDTYVKEVQGILDDPNVKDVLSGKEVAQEAQNTAEALLVTAMSDQFVDVVDRVKRGQATQADLNDFKNGVEFITNRNVAGVSLSSTLEGTLQRALGYKQEAPVPKNPNLESGETDASTAPAKANLLIRAANSVSSLFKDLTTEDAGQLNKAKKSSIEYKLDKGEQLNQNDLNWVLDSLSFGQNGNSQMQGKGASKAIQEAPLDLLSRDDYNTTMKATVDAFEADGGNVTGVLLSALEKHIKNNVGNAYSQLIRLGTSGTMLSSATGIRKDRNRPSLGSSTYNLGEVVQLNNESGKLVFKYKEGTLGQQTDIQKIQDIAKLNKALVVVNKFVKAMSNVNEVDSSEIANEVMGLLNRDLNIPVNTSN